MSDRRQRDPFEPDTRQSRRQRQEEQRSRRSEQERPRRRRWPWVLLVLLVIIGLLPNLIGWFGLQNQLIPMALGDFQGKVNVRSASVGWFQPITLQGIEASDLAGNPLATIEEVRTSKPLYAFLTGNDYGEVDVHKPVVFFSGRTDGSNIEDSLSRYLANSEPSPLGNAPKPAAAPMKLPKMLVRVHEGAARIESDGSPQVWQIDSLEATAAVSQAESPLAATVQFRSSSFLPDGQGKLVSNESGTVWLNTVVDPGAESLSFSSADVSAKTEQFPLSMIAPLSERFIGRSRIAGGASADISAAWKASTNEVQANIKSLQLTGPEIDAPDLLSGDTFRVDQLTAHGALQLSPSHISAKQFVVETDFGRIDANGEFDPGQLAQLSAGGQPNGAVLPDTNLQVEGEIDLAKLLGTLPATFQLHEDLKIESGKLKFSAGQRNDADAKRLVVNIDTANLRALRAGQPIVWQQPLRVVGVLNENGGALSLESLELISEFLNIEGSATLRQGMFRINGNLGSLSKRVRQFADLGEIQLDGELDGQFGWQVTGNENVDVSGLVNEPIQMGGEFLIKRPIIEMPGIPRWSTEEVVIRTSGSGQLSGAQENQKLRVNQAGAQLVIGSENALMSLAQPVTDAFTQQQWVFNSQVTGQLSKWLAHIRNFVDPGDIQASGTLDFAGVAIVDSNLIRIDNGQYEIKELGFVGYGTNINEDRVVGTVNANYSLESGNVGVPQATLQGSGISASAQNLTLTMGDAMQLAGSAAWRADINRLAEWLSLSGPDSINWYGAAEGSIDFTNSANGTDATFRADLSDLVATQKATTAQPTQPMQMAGNQQAWTEIWREERVNMSGQFSLGSDFDSIQLHQLATRSGSVDFDAKGSISELSGVMNLDVAGTWQPNFDKIQTLMAATTDDLVQLTGGVAEPFKIVGPLFETTPSGGWVPQQLAVETGLGWQSGRLAGLPIGKGEVAVNLSQQVASVRTTAAGIPVSQGVAHLQPQLDLRGTDLVLVHGQSQVLDRVQVTPEICREFLKFVAPLLSDTTNAEGVISASLQGLNMPLSDFQKVSARGSLVMEDVTVAAGPLAEQLLATVTQLQSVLKPGSRERELKTWLKVEQQTIPLAIENGRVYHEGIKFSHDELIIRTSGSVGFDQGLELVAEIPIAAQWLEGNQYLAGLKGQSISIPIGGTVNKPVIDQSKVRQLSADLVRNAATGALNNAITDKIAPKVNQEVNKLQSQFQNKIGGFLGDKLGVPANAQTPAGQVPATQTPAGAAQSVGQGLEDRLNNELQNGFNKLFGG